MTFLFESPHCETDFCRKLRRGICKHSCEVISLLSVKIVELKLVRVPQKAEKGPPGEHAVYQNNTGRQQMLPESQAHTNTTNKAAIRAEK